MDRDDLEALGWRIEASKRGEHKIHVPVLVGQNGEASKNFEVDAFDPATGSVLEFEAGRAVVNRAFPKDQFKACMMHDIDYLAVAVRSMYKKSNDLERVYGFFNTLFTSRCLIRTSGV